MQAELILRFVERQIREIGFSHFILDYEQVEVPASQTTRLSAYNNLYLLCESPKSVRIRSDLGA